MGTGIRVGGGALLVFAVLTLLTGGDPMDILQMALQGGGPGGGVQSQQPAGPPPGSAGTAPDPHAEFISVVLGTTETVWGSMFRNEGATYHEPKLVLFEESVESACGVAGSAVGPFYCPGDQKVYLDLSFFRELDKRFGAPGDFAQAYVVAHEVGHHVQNLLGISTKVSQAQRRASEQDANGLSVALELQADCFAGVWGNHLQKDRQLLEPGDVEEGLAAAAAVGDDRIQKSAGRQVSPESWTHGSAEMRMRWFRRGFESGQINQCDTFNAPQL